MGKTPDALTPEQKADLGNLAARQSEVAKGLQNLQERMDEMAKRLDESDPLAAVGDARGRRARAASRGPPPRWARPPTSSRRTRWARPGHSQETGPAGARASSSTRSRTAASASSPGWSRS